MIRAIVVPERCPACQRCGPVEVCENRAFIREAPADRPWVDFLLCRGCRRCVPACPHAAIDVITQPCSGTARPSW